MFDVEFYKFEDGTKPVGQFIRSIEDEKLRAKVIRSVKLLDKKTQKAPREEIAIAKERRADYEQRQKKDKRH